MAINNPLSNAVLDAQLGVYTGSAAKAAPNTAPGANGMILDGDIIVRRVKNGYRVIAVSGTHVHPDEYVATDFDDLFDVLKLASVNHKLAASK